MKNLTHFAQPTIVATFLSCMIFMGLPANAENNPPVPHKQEVYHTLKSVADWQIAHIGRYLVHDALRRSPASPAGLDPRCTLGGHGEMGKTC